MSEYAAIRIDFTLQGLYTCTHSPRIQPGATRLSPRHQNKTIRYGTIPIPSGWDATPSWLGRPGVVWLSPYHPKFHQAPMLLPHRASFALPYS